MGKLAYPLILNKIVGKKGFSSGVIFLVTNRINGILGKFETKHKTEESRKTNLSRASQTKPRNLSSQIADSMIRP